MDTVKYILGEDKYIKLWVHSPDNEPFIIEWAEYELALNTEVVDKGQCIVEDHYISRKLAPSEIGVYILTITYRVADTTRKTKLRLEVV